MSMDGKVRVELVAQAARFANNMIVEVIGNHGKFLSAESRAHLSQATVALGKFQLSLTGDPEKNDLDPTPSTPP